jgi:hypothetical protein
MKTIPTEKLQETTGGYGPWGQFYRAAAFANAVNGYGPAYAPPPPPAYGYGYGYGYGWRGRYW